MDIICYKPDGQILDHYFQWDIGQELMIKGADVSSAPYFYFTNTVHNTAYAMPSKVCGDAILVNVPDILLQDAVPLVLYITYDPEGNGETTDNAVRIPVFPKQKPNDYVFNPGSGNPDGSMIGSIVNNLTTNDSAVALSAAQGVVLKALIDSLDDKKIERTDLQDLIVKAMEDAVESGQITGIQGEQGLPGDPGKDGRGIISVERTFGDGSSGTTDVYTITYTDSTTSTFSVYNGKDGVDSSASPDDDKSGEDGATFTPYVDILGNLSWTNDKGLDNPASVNIMGADGVSCTHNWDGTVLTVNSASGASSADLRGADGKNGVGITSIKQTEKSTNDDGNNVVTIVLSDGTISTITIQNGSKGSPGNDGTPGNDGVSIISVEQTTVAEEDKGVNVVTVSLSNDTSFTFEVKNGSQGSPGNDGISPTISVSQITGGSQIILTDINGSKTVDIMNGNDGRDGYIPVRGVDYYTVDDKNEIVGLVKDSIPEYMPTILTSDYYGTELPDHGVEGRLFFLLSE